MQTKGMQAMTRVPWGRGIAHGKFVGGGLFPEGHTGNLESLTVSEPGLRNTVRQPYKHGEIHSCLILEQDNLQKANGAALQEIKRLL